MGKCREISLVPEEGGGGRGSGLAVPIAGIIV